MGSRAADAVECPERDGRAGNQGPSPSAAHKNGVEPLKRKRRHCHQVGCAGQGEDGLAALHTSRWAVIEPRPWRQEPIVTTTFL